MNVIDTLEAQRILLIALRGGYFDKILGQELKMNKLAEILLHGKWPSAVVETKVRLKRTKNIKLVYFFKVY